MIIGVPRERKTLEKRVAITPDGAHELVGKGHKVLLETSAGLGSFFTDEAYSEAGCELVPTLEEVWKKSELIVKVKEPHESEYPFFRKDLAIFDYLHLASMPDLTKTMLTSGITGIAYELVQTEDKRLPLLEPMSEVAGKLSILVGAHSLLAQHGGRGVLLGGTIGVPPGNVVIVGAGVAGRNACEIALGMGANVTILDTDAQKLEKIKLQFSGRAHTLYSTKGSLERACERAELVVGAVLIPGAAAPRIVTRQMIRSMKPGAVFVDISIDQGGCAETIRTTSLESPTYEEEGVIHYGVPNMPAQTPRTSTLALTSATLPYILKIANLGVTRALKEIKELRNAVNTRHGALTNRAVSEAVGIPFTGIEGTDLG